MMKLLSRSPLGSRCYSLPYTLALVQPRLCPIFTFFIFPSMVSWIPVYVAFSHMLFPPPPIFQQRLSETLGLHSCLIGVVFGLVSLFLRRAWFFSCESRWRVDIGRCGCAVVVLWLLLGVHLEVRSTSVALE